MSNHIEKFHRMPISCFLTFILLLSALVWLPIHIQPSLLMPPNVCITSAVLLSYVRIVTLWDVICVKAATLHVFKVVLKCDGVAQNRLILYQKV